MKRAWYIALLLTVAVCALAGWRYPAAFDSLSVRLGLSALIVTVSWRLSRRKQATKPAAQPNEPQGKPVPGTRRYARMLYANKLISMEELNRYYAEFPEEG